MSQLKIFLLLTLGGTLLLGCERNTEWEVEGYQPVYSADSVAIKSVEARPVKNPGKIYYKDNFIFINEKSLGVHVIDNTDPTHPKNISFIRIPYNSDVSIKETYMYANNGNHLAVIDISNPLAAVVVKEVQNVIDFDKNSQDLYPPEQGFYFDCVDPDKGMVIGWEKADLTNPQCFR
ncbi:MAG: hypothetical protein WD077_06760 [Bacteroidia bacterium]